MALSIIKKIIHILSYIAYILIGLYGIVCIPMIFGYKPVVVLSGSMEPTYKVGSVIYYNKVSKEDLKVGDVITFTQGNDYVSHRINNIEGDLYETKGDANKSVDAKKIEYSSIVGRVHKCSIPFIGYYIKFVNENLFIAVITLIIILIAEFIFSNIEFNNKKKGEIVNEGSQE